MKLKTSIITVTSLSLGLMFAQISLAASPKAPTKPLTEMKTLSLCVDYSTLKSSSEKKAYIKELDRRVQLASLDYDNIKQHKVVKGSTRCAMYMALGKPITEKGKYIRPMVFKVVHVYPKQYIVSQTGMVVNILPRKKGSIPPALSVPAPKVQAAPEIYAAPGGTIVKP